jgi:hypothetical protein
MNSTPNPSANEADDALVARADKRLAHAYEQIAQADEQLARLTEHLSKMEHDTPHHAAVAPQRKPSRGGAALRGLIGLLSAAGIVIAAFVSQSSYGDAAKLAVYHWAPHLVSTLWLPPEKSGLPGQPSPSAIQVATAEAAPLQATAAVRTAVQDAAPTPPEVAQLLQEMTRALANVEQGVEELKAGQERMANDNAKVAEQLRASQEQITLLVAKTSEIAKTSEQSPAPKASGAPLPRPSPTRKPVSTHLPPQARSQPQTPVQLEPEDR